MSRKPKILMLTNIVVLLFLVGNIINAQALDRSWNPGDIITFTYSYQNIYIDTDLEYNVVNEIDIIDQETGTLNITELNLLNGRYYAIWTGKLGEGPIVGYDFTVEDFKNDFLDINTFLYVDYEWNYGTNDTVLVDFDVNYDPWLLIEPNWADLNTAFIDMFNESEIIESIADPYLPIIYNITLGDFLGNISYTFMGKNTLAEAKNQMTPDNTQWTLTFDLSNVVHQGIYNATLGYDVYYPYQNAIITYDLSYSKGGILEKAHGEMSIGITVDNSKNEICNKNIIIQGDLRALTSNNAYWMILPGFLIVLSIVRIANRKSNRRIW